MEVVRVSGSESDYYGDFWKLYQSSFPVHEKRTSGRQEGLFGDPRYHLDFYTEAGVLVAFMSYWDFDDVIYIEHYAVNPAMRGGGYGSSILDRFLMQASKPVVLEIDPVEDEISARRLRFYKALGFAKNPYKHIQPAYAEGFDGFVLTVLSYPRALCRAEYDKFYGELCAVFTARND